MDNQKKIIPELTKAEMEIMQVVWQIDDNFVVRDVHERLPEPRPAYSTVATMVRILDTKGFLSHKTYGHSNVYQAAVSKAEYTDLYMHNVLHTFFDGSVSRLVNYFSQRKSISMDEADEILQMLNNKQ